MIIVPVSQLRGSQPSLAAPVDGVILNLQFTASHSEQRPIRYIEAWTKGKGGKIPHNEKLKCEVLSQTPNFVNLCNQAGVEMTPSEMRDLKEMIVRLFKEGELPAQP